jgi:hypothetical protein
MSLEVESMEPFHQVNRPNGATGRRSIFLDFDEWRQFFVPILSLQGGHYAIALSSSVEYLSALVGPLAAEAVSMGLIGSCSSSSAKGCATVVRVSELPTRVLQGVMVVIAVLTLGLLALTARRKYGVTDDPRSISRITLLASDRLLGLFRQVSLLQTENKVDALERNLGDLTYKLDQENIFGGSEVAIYPCDQTDSSGEDLSDNWRLRPGGLKNVLNSCLFHFFRPWVKLAVFLAFHVGFASLLIVYSLTSGETAFEHFMASQSFGVRFLFSLLGVLVSFGWLSLFKGK